MTDCNECTLPLEGEDKVFAENQEEHPGYLGLIHRSCYSKLVDKEPLLPWTDPISGEIDYNAASSDLDIDDGRFERDDWE